MPLIIPANTISGGYEVANSCRFNSGSSDYLNRTQSGAGNRKTFTFSVWLKMALDDVATDIGIFSYYNDVNNFGKIGIQGDNNQFAMYSRTGGTFNTNVQISSMARDTSAWLNLVVAVDTTQSTDSNRIKFYINGTQQTSFVSSTYPSQNTDLEFNTTHSNYVSNWNGSSQHFDGYMTEVVFIDGQQLTPTSFGEFDEDSGIWKPIDVSGLTFGTNGFYLDFENSGSLGADVSGNGNNFTVNNLTAIDQSTDTCTNNFATFNSLSKNDAGTVTFSDGNLKTAHSGTDSRYSAYSTIGVSQGKWYAEFKYEATSGGSDVHFGIGSDIENTNRTGGNVYSSATGYVYWSNDGSKGNNDSTSSYGNSFAVGDIIGIALDLDNYKLYFSKNGVWQNSGDPTSGATGTGSAFNLTSGETYFFAGTHATSTSRTSTYSANFGNPPYSISSGNSDANGYGNFEYAVPSGYYSLNSKNLAEYG